MLPMRLCVTVQSSAGLEETLLVPVAKGATIFQICKDIERRAKKIPGFNAFEVACLRRGKADGPCLNDEDEVHAVLTEGDHIFAGHKEVSPKSLQGCAPPIIEACAEAPEGMDPTQEEAQVSQWLPARFDQAEGHPTVRVFDKPDRAHATIIGAIASGTCGFVLKEDVNGFYKVHLDDNEGWVGMKNVMLGGSPALGVPARFDQAEGHPTVRVFDKPDRDHASIIGEITSGMGGFVIKEDDNGFYKVHLDDIEGWVGVKNVMLGGSPALGHECRRGISKRIQDSIAELLALKLSTDGIVIDNAAGLRSNLSLLKDHLKGLEDTPKISDGKISLASLFTHAYWSPAFDAHKALLDMIALLSDPNSQDKPCHSTRSTISELQNLLQSLRPDHLARRMSSNGKETVNQQHTVASKEGKGEEGTSGIPLTVDGTPEDIIQTVPSKAAVEDQPVVSYEHDALVEVGRTIVLIIGNCGDGKSTLVNDLILDTEPIALASNNVRGTTKGIRAYRGKKNRLILDTPGIGDCTVPPLKLLAMLEETLSPHGRGVDYVVITTSLLTNNFDLGNQFARALVENGFLQDGGGNEWEHIIYCGTKKDRAVQGDFKCFQAKANIFYDEAPNQTGVSVVVGKTGELYDSTELDDAMKGDLHQKIKFKKIEEGKLARTFAAPLGFKDIDSFVKQLGGYRDEMEKQTVELREALSASSERWKEIDQKMQELLRQVSLGIVSEDEAVASKAMIESELSLSRQENACLMEKFELFEIAQKEADDHVKAQANMFDLQMEATLQSRHRTRLRVEAPASSKNISTEEEIGDEVPDKFGEDKDFKGAVIQHIAAKTANQHIAPTEAMTRKATPGNDSMTLADLRGNVLSDVKKIERDAGIDHQAVDDCDTVDDPKHAVTQNCSRRRAL